MNKTLFGLALLSYNWEHNKKDVIDSYIPLVCNCIRSKMHRKVIRELVQSDLLEFYGINIPLGAIETILKRMAHDGLLKRRSGEYFVNNEKVYQASSNTQDDLDIAFKTLIVDLNNYSQDVFQVQFTTEEIESGLITFFKENDLDLLFANNNGESVLPKVKESKKVKYIIAKFITDLQRTEPARFAIVLKLAKGYAIASLITYNDIQNYSGSLSNVEVYLDAPIIFNLLGLNGDSNLRLGKELIETLRANGANLKVFEINYEEVIKTIQDAIKRLISKKYDVTRSSRILRTAVRENISAQQLQIKLNQVDVMLQQLSIDKVASPSLEQVDYIYQIDETELQLIIEDLYKRGGTDRIPWHKANQIERDVKSISNIFKIRKRTYATSLKVSKAILLTSNEFIAYAAKKYERSEWEFKSTIPVCVTDIFLSTILWVNYPSKNDNLNIKLLISDCYNIIELDNRLLNKFYEDITRMHNENKINDEQFYLLNASNLTYALLEQKTLNDIDEYTDKTPSEILQDLELRMSEGLLVEQEKLSRIDKNIRVFSKFVAKSFFVLVAVLLIWLSILFKAKKPQLDTNWYNYSAWAVSAIIGVFGFLRWMEIVPTRFKIESWIEEWLFNKIKNLLSKE